MIKLNGNEITPTIFPDGTSQVWKLYPKPKNLVNVVEWKFENEAEFLHLAQLKHLIDSFGGKCFLEISYLPYARQDKETSNETTFALNPFSDLLNSLNFEGVSIFDPHSDIAL